MDSEPTLQLLTDKRRGHLFTFNPVNISFVTVVVVYARSVIKVVEFYVYWVYICMCTLSIYNINIYWILSIYGYWSLSMYIKSIYTYIISMYKIHSCNIYIYRINILNFIYILNQYIYFEFYQYIYWINIYVFWILSIYTLNFIYIVYIESLRRVVGLTSLMLIG